MLPSSNNIFGNILMVGFELPGGPPSVLTMVVEVGLGESRIVICAAPLADLAEDFSILPMHYQYYMLQCDLVSARCKRSHSRVL